MDGGWSGLEVGGKPADVYEPPGRRPRFGVLYLHDSDGVTLKERPAYTGLLGRLGLACVCPHGGPCWWADRACPEFDAARTPERYLLEAVLPSFNERWGLAPRSIGLLGVGMGGQGALRLAFKRPDLFPVVAAVAPALDYHDLYGRGTALDAMYDSKEQCRQDTALMHVPPFKPPPHVLFCIDPDDARWFRGNDRLHEKLNALGVEHQYDFTTRAGGHSWQYFDHRAERVLSFVVHGLEHESRRLL